MWRRMLKVDRLCWWVASRRGKSRSTRTTCYRLARLRDRVMAIRRVISDRCPRILAPAIAAQESATDVAALWMLIHFFRVDPAHQFAELRAGDFDGVGLVFLLHRFEVLAAALGFFDPLFGEF